VSTRLKRVALHTLGCKLNYAETDTLAQRFEEAGYETIAFNEPADVYVIKKQPEVKKIQLTHDPKEHETKKIESN